MASAFQCIDSGFPVSQGSLCPGVPMFWDSLFQGSRPQKIRGAEGFLDLLKIYSWLLLELATPHSQDSFL